MFIELYARWKAKRKYVYKELFESAIADLQAGLSESRAQDRLDSAAQLLTDADAIEENIKTEEATPEYKALEGKELYEANHERNEALKIVASKRQEAEQEKEQAKGSIDTAKMFRRQAAAGRETAERLKRL
jgi:hypothetical protein